MKINHSLQYLIDKYKVDYINSFNDKIEKDISIHSNHILKCWKLEKNIFIIGNGGSGANAQHIANDFLYGAALSNKKGIKIEALVSNSAVITCLANDIDYDSIFRTIKS